MDSVLFLKTISRMCSSYDSECDGCPIAIEIKRKGEYLDCYGFIKLYIEEVVEVVEKWDKEHPVKTRQSEILKIFPNIPKTPDGYLNICPQELVPFRCDTNTECGACLQDFWSMEISIE